MWTRKVLESTPWNLLSRDIDFDSGIVKSGSLHSGNLLSRATDFGSGIVTSGILYTLGIYSLGLAIFDLES